MGLPLKDISGFPEKIIQPLTGIKKEDEQALKLDFYNQGIDIMATKEIYFVKKKMINAILKLWRKYDRLNVQVDSREEAEQIADAIISASSTILEVKNKE